VDEATRRAVRKLAQHGLLDLDDKGIDRRARDPRRERQFFFEGEWRQYKPEYQTRRLRVYKRTMRLTPVGAAVVDVLRDELQAGQAIRWERRQAAIMEKWRSAPADLLADFQQEIHKMRGACGHLAALEGMIGKGNGKAAPMADNLSLVGTAIDREYQSIEDREDELSGRAGCPRCGRHVFTMHNFCDVTLCQECWAELGKEWQAKQQNDARGQ